MAWKGLGQDGATEIFGKIAVRHWILSTLIPAPWDSAPAGSATVCQTILGYSDLKLPALDYSSCTFRKISVRKRYENIAFQYAKGRDAPS